MNDISLLRRKLIYRSWHRGCKETDILLGYFALEHLGKFSQDELIEYEKIVDLDDHELYCYITGKKTVPSNISSEMIKLISSFNPAEAQKRQA